MKVSIAPLVQKLGLSEILNPLWKDIFEEAFTHRSFAGTHKNCKYNERLEFLGDAVLELVITDYLYHRFPDTDEGQLTSMRSALVKRDQLAAVARRLNLGTYLKLSRGEASSGGAEKDYLLANCMESLLGAIYLTYGRAEAERIIRENISCDLDTILKNNSHIDSKSHLQEITQGTLGITPSYHVTSDSGPDHDKQFLVGVYLNKVKVGSGTGKSKKEAQNMAATNAIEEKPIWWDKFHTKTP